MEHQNGTPKLTEEQVREIRRKYVPFKYGYRKLAAEYHVSFKSIGRIITRETWKHVV